MSAAHFHLMLNHIPLLGLLFGAALLAYGLWRGSEDVQKASLGLLAGAGLSALAVYLTGEPAEEVVEGLAGVSHDAIEAHEEFGLYALVGGLVTALTALGALGYALFRRRLVRWTAVLTLVLAVVSSGLIGYTANLGGAISHPELRGTASSVVAPDADAPSSTPESATDTEHEDEH